MTSRVWKNALDLMRLARGINPMHGNSNCVDCAIALDHTLVGHPMTAPNSGMKSGEKLAAAYGRTSEDFVGFGSIIDLLQYVVENGVRQGIILAIERRPESAEAMSGHPFNVVCDGRQPIMIDAQSGMITTGRTLYNEPVWNQFFLLRTDDFHALSGAP
jgi:hypothetical protein